MLTVPEITAWRLHAPWPTDAQVETDLLVVRAMLAIFQNPFLANELAMRGGTALHKLHLPPAARYSDDVDLVLVGTNDVAKIECELVRVLEPVLGRPVDRLKTRVQLSLRSLTQKSRISRLVYRTKATLPPHPMLRVKIEVNFSERRPVFPLMTIPFSPPVAGLATAVSIQTFSLEEMLATKMRALLQRDQPRDLFDLDLACRKQPEISTSFDPDRVVAAFDCCMRNEGRKIARGEFERSLARKIRLRSFRCGQNIVRGRGVMFDVRPAVESVSQLLFTRIR